MKRTLRSLYVLLLLLSVGCTIQQRSDGGFRIDLPPFFGRYVAPAPDPTSTPLPTDTAPQQVITVVVTATPTENITATTAPGQTIPFVTPTDTPAGTIPGTTIPPVAVTATGTATSGPTHGPTGTPPAATAPSTGTIYPTGTVAPTSRSGGPFTPTSQPGTSTSAPGTSTPGTPAPGTPTGAPGTPSPGTPIATPPSTGTAPSTPSTGTPSTGTPPGTPPGTPTGEPSPSATPAPAGIYVGSEQSYIEGSTLYVVGEVVNATGQTVYNVKVIGTFFEGNRVIAAGETLTLLPASVPGSANPFKLVVPNAPSNLERYELALVWDDISILTYERLRTLREELVEADDGAQITGEIANNSATAMRDVRVVATLYDESGAVINAFAGTPAETMLGSGESTTYVIEIPAGVEFTGYLVQSQGMLAAQ